MDRLIDPGGTAPGRRDQLLERERNKREKEIRERDEKSKQWRTGGR